MWFRAFHREYGTGSIVMNPKTMAAFNIRVKPDNIVLIKLPSLSHGKAFVPPLSTFLVSQEASDVYV